MASGYPHFFVGKQRSELAKELKEANELLRIYRNKIARQKETIHCQKNEIDSLTQKLESQRLKYYNLQELDERDEFQKEAQLDNTSSVDIVTFRKELIAAGPEEVE